MPVVSICMPGVYVGVYANKSFAPGFDMNLSTNQTVYGITG